MSNSGKSWSGGKGYRQRGDGESMKNYHNNDEFWDNLKKAKELKQQQENNDEREEAE